MAVSVAPYTVNSTTPNTALHRAQGRKTMNRAACSTASLYFHLQTLQKVRSSEAQNLNADKNVNV